MPYSFWFHGRDFLFEIIQHHTGFLWHFKALAYILFPLLISHHFWHFSAGTPTRQSSKLHCNSNSTGESGEHPLCSSSFSSWMVHRNRCGPGTAWLPIWQFRGVRRQETKAKNRRKAGQEHHLPHPTLKSQVKYETCLRKATLGIGMPGRKRQSL